MREEVSISVSGIRDMLKARFNKFYEYGLLSSAGFICLAIQKVCAVSGAQLNDDRGIVEQLGMLYCGDSEYFSNSYVGIEESLSDSELLQFYRKGMKYLSSIGSYDFSDPQYKYEHFRYRGDPDAGIQVKFGRVISRIGLLTEILERHPDAEIVVEV